MIEKLSTFLKNECFRQNLSAEELSRKCNGQISADYIRKIIRQTPKTVTIDILEVIASGLGMTLKELLEKSGIIDLNDNYILTNEDADSLIEQLSPIIEPVVDVSQLTRDQRNDFANHLYEYIKMISYKYR